MYITFLRGISLHVLWNRPSVTSVGIKQKLSSGAGCPAIASCGVSCICPWILWNGIQVRSDSFHHCYAYIPVKKTACYCMQTNKTTTLRGNVCSFKVYFYFAVSIKVLLSWNPIRELISLWVRLMLICEHLKVPCIPEPRPGWGLRRGVSQEGGTITVSSRYQ